MVEKVWLVIYQNWIVVNCNNCGFQKKIIGRLWKAIIFFMAHQVVLKDKRLKRDINNLQGGYKNEWLNILNLE